MVYKGDGTSVALGVSMAMSQRPVGTHDSLGTWGCL